MSERLTLRLIEPVQAHKAMATAWTHCKAVRHALEPAWAADTQRKIHAMGKWPKGIPYPQNGQK